MKTTTIELLRRTLCRLTAAAVLLAVPAMVFATAYDDDDDDLYYSPKKAAQKKKEAEKQMEAEYAKSLKDLKSLDMDVDTYNRVKRGDRNEYTLTSADSLAAEQGDFTYTRMLQKYHGSQVVLNSGDYDLVTDIYAPQGSDVNVYVVNQAPSLYSYMSPWDWTYPYSGWGYRPYRWGWYGPSFSFTWGPTWGWYDPCWSWSWGCPGYWPGHHHHHGYWPGYYPPGHGGGWHPTPSRPVNPGNTGRYPSGNGNVRPGHHNSTIVTGNGHQYTRPGNNGRPGVTGGNSNAVSTVRPSSTPKNPGSSTVGTRGRNNSSSSSSGTNRTQSSSSSRSSSSSSYGSSSRNSSNSGSYRAGGSSSRSSYGGGGSRGGSSSGGRGRR